MPGKFLKSFNRRKSSVNPLDEVQQSPTTGTFRVIPRPQTEHDFSPAGRLSKETPSHKSKAKSCDDLGLTNRGGLRTNQSTSTVGGSSSTNRNSNGSTEPSSVESVTQDDYHYRNHAYYNQDPQKLGPPTSFRAPPAASATLPSRFGQPRNFLGDERREAGSSMSDINMFGLNPRDRATTTSSYASTATPSKFNLKTDPKPSESPAFGEDFDNIFSGMPPRTNFARQGEPSPPPPIARVNSESPVPFKNTSGTVITPHTKVLSNELDQYPKPDFRRNSWESHRSQDDFRISKVEEKEEPPEVAANGDSVSPQDAVDPNLVMDALYASSFLQQREAQEQREQARAEKAKKPQSHTPRSRSRTPITMFREAERASGRNSPAMSAGADESLFYNNAPSPKRSPKPQLEAPAVPKTATKLMTPEEFEYYKQEAALDDDERSEKSEESATYEDDEDEIEREKELAKHRRKQEANLAVYRQQMMKVAAERSSESNDTNQKPLLQRGESSPAYIGNLGSDNFRLNDFGSGDQKAPGSDEEDEDVPLGVLQAHGFPNKNRPPTRMSMSSSHIDNLRSVSQMGSYPAPPGSTRNDAAAGGGGSGPLPEFARRLPMDPYVGANLVNHSKRESLAYNANQGYPQAAPGAAPLPPGGLVGVIAGEERAKALRRGSPNSNGTYGNLSRLPQEPVVSPPTPQMLLQQQQQQQQHLSPAEQAQLQMSQQMNQMMQMQMQWMQQMMQMQGMQGMQMPNMPAMPQMPGMPSMGDMLPQPGFAGGMPNQAPNRRDSIMSSSSSVARLAPPRAQSTMSHYGSLPSRTAPAALQDMRLNQSMANLNMNMNTNLAAPQPGYAASLAPSERSNIGQPSRYRPVTPVAAAAGAPGARTNTMNRQTVQGFKMTTTSGEALGLPPQPPAHGQKPNTVRAVSRPRAGAAGDSDDEDEAGWRELQKKRDERKSRWRLGRKKDTLAPGSAKGADAASTQGTIDSGVSGMGSSVAPQDEYRGHQRYDADFPSEGLEGLYYDGSFAH